jgi:hypothetical protein
MAIIRHNDINDHELRRKIKSREICLGGNARLRIYGMLHCASGKRMKRENRVFFTSEQEALQSGYRPCGHCMKSAYQRWKANLKSRP